ncbi:hypothetical protein LCGC14_0836690 [marine sediment metagenome]|uniref:Uncharacterized protein n=1 Tax=marine sediment metagenome TaxID=412755 RepID=A0A0F9PE96_9ZZZZ
MGLFSSLFGSSGSDKADKMRQAAIDAFNSIQTPELKDLQIQLDKYVAAGRLTPAQAEAELLKSNAFNDIVTDPALEGAQKQALVALQEIGTQGGLTAIDKARMADITSEQSQVARGRNESIMSQARERGMGGSDISTINQLMSEQSAADRASRRGTDVAANAEARALQALIQGGQMATGMRTQDYGEQATRAGAENALDLFNKQTLNQTNLYNVDAANKAQAANLANEQAIANANVGTTNYERQYNAERNQQLFEDKMAKASGVAGVYGQWAGDATAAKRSEQAADAALLGGALQAVPPAFKNPFSGPSSPTKGAPSAASEATTSGFQTAYDKDLYGTRYAHGGEVLPENELERHRLEMAGYNRPPMVQDFKNGGVVPGQAVAPGNNPVNDTVTANLSPGEVVVPKTAMSDDQEFDMFMEKFRPSSRIGRR